MTSEAPEQPDRIWRWVLKNAGGFVEYADHPIKSPWAREYIRADLHQQALAEAEARGRAQAVEEVVSRLVERVSELAGDVDKEVREDRLSGYTEGLLDEAEGLLEEIRGLAQKEGER